jgi:mono/diheme cytochrome c family protein
MVQPRVECMRPAKSGRLAELLSLLLPAPFSLADGKATPAKPAAKRKWESGFYRARQEGINRQVRCARCHGRRRRRPAGSLLVPKAWWA